MGSFKPSTALREFDRLALEPDESSFRAALAWIARMRPHFTAQADPLARARYLLRAASLRETEQTLPEVIEGLLVAFSVFRAHEQPRDLALSLSRLSYWYGRQGLHPPSLLCSHHALRRPELPDSERLRLKVARATRLAYECQLPAAWALLATLDRSRLRPTEVWMLDAVQGLLHIAEALRARREVSEFAIDVEPGPPDPALGARHLADSRACMERIGPAERKLPLIRHLQAFNAALTGDAATVRTLFRPDTGPRRSPMSEALEQYNHAWCLRILGEADRARTLHLDNVDRVAALAYPRLDLLLCLDLHACALALGDPAEAVTWLTRYLRVRTHQDQLIQEALHALSHALEARSVGPVSPPAERSGAPLPPEAEPASLGQVETLFLARLPRRTPLSRLATEAGVSIRTLQLAARRYRHCTLGDMLRRRLMDRALELLRHSGMTITQVAAALGYSEPSSLSRDVRRHFGCTPRTLRAGSNRPTQPQA